MEINNNASLNHIAVVGMSGRFPAAADISAFWENLMQGKQSSVDLSDDELRASGVPESYIYHKDFVKKAYVVADVDQFDASFFQFTAKEAQITDPQQRILLECCYEAFEHAGYSSDKYDRLVGVYVGTGPQSYYIRNLLPQTDLLDSVGHLRMSIGNEKSFASTMVSYKLNLKGPSVNVDTACSTSLVAVHQACQSLLAYDCDTALAGGVSLDSPQKIGMFYQEGSIIAPDGCCRPFDAAAKGTVKGNGAGIVVLKRLADAIADGDTIYAVIKGSATNNDGAVKVGYTASSAEGQMDVIAEALARAEVNPRQIRFVEAHGTGTILGDPIEVKALSEVYLSQTDATEYCAIGSVKANIGHLDIAAGVAGLIKSTLALYHKIVPKTINYETPNPNIDFSNSPFFPNKQPLSLADSQGDAHAAVSSFGIGGSNAHVILAEAPAAESAEPSNRTAQLILLSAKSAHSLELQCQALATHLATEHTQALSDVAYTLQVGRNEFVWRAAVVATEHSQAVAQLGQQSRGLIKAQSSSEKPAVYFMFPGQGAQHVLMTADLYQQEPVFRQHLDQCAGLFAAELGFDIRDDIFAEQNDSRLNQTLVSQPALFSVEYALAQLWQSLGVMPAGMIGHSIGEYVAACLAGVFSLADAVRLIAARARLMQQVAPGAMLMVQLSEQQVAPYLTEYCSLAAVNGPAISVLAGGSEHLAGLQQQFEQQQIGCRLLQTSHAFHSWMLEPVLADFLQAVQQIDLQAPSLPFVSNLTGDWIDSDQATDPHYWVRHLRETVQFGKGLALLLTDPQAVLLEVGPNQVLTTLAKRSFGHKSVVATARHTKDKRDDVEHWLQAVGALWCEGVSFDWLQLHGGTARKRVPLPAYQFDRQSYWVGPGSPVKTVTTVAAAAQPLAAKAEPGKPQNVAELVAGIWSDAFGVSHIKSSDNFFALGGDSLLATQLISVLKQKLQVDVSLSELFEAADFGEFIQALAAKVSAGCTGTGNSGIQPVAADIANRHQPFPLTDIQQAYWVGRTGAVELGDVSTHIYLEVDIKHGCIAKFQSAWNRLIRHHDMLRAVFLETGEQQILAQTPEYQFDILDLQGMPKDQAVEQQLQLRKKMSHQILPCDTWPLFDIKAARFTEHQFRLCISIDILIVDAWSMNMLIEQWLQLYRDPDFKLREMQFSFRDYVIAEHDLRETELYYRSEEYWFQRIDTLPDAPSLPLAVAPNSIKDVRFERRFYEMEAARWSVLKNRAKQHGVTPTGLLIAAFSEVLALWCQNPHFTLNLTNYSRHPFHDDAEYIVGDFTSLTLLEVKTDASRSFINNAELIQKQLWRDLDNRYVSAIHVLREMGKRSGGRVSMPIVFTSTLGGRALEHEHTSSELGEEVFGVSQTSQVWLDHQVMEWQGKLRFNWDVVEALFPAGMIQAMFDVYCDYIERLVDDAQLWQVKSLDHLLPPADAQWIAKANQTEDRSCQPQLLHESFIAMAMAQPGQIAVIDGERQLTYRELYAYSQLVAQQLRQQGVQPNQLVGIFIEKSWQQIAAVMAILTAGAAYLPMDVSLPAERLNYMVTNSNMVALVSANAQLPSIPAAAAKLYQVNIDALDHELLAAAALAAPLESVQEIDDLAYVLYTSGSTGQPKGAMLPHRGPANTVRDMLRILAVQPSDRFIALSALHFDLSVFDVFGALSAGAALVMVPPAAELAPQQWHQLVQQHRITVWNSVPALMQIYVDYAEQHPASQHALQRVVLSGDWIPPRLPARMFTQWPAIQVLGAGGPTECSIWDACHWISQADTEKDSIPYGYPMANHRIYILNQQLQQCPLGVVGEMYVGGDGLAIGYMADAAKTDAVFITHPETGERLYKSGDLGRYTADEQAGLEIIGRSDFQVKINGYRIELGEIENAIRDVGAYDDVVVVAQDGQISDGKARKQLVAYLVGKSAATVGETQALADKQAKLVAFKLSKPGLRKDLPTDGRVTLPPVQHDVAAYQKRKSYREYAGDGLNMSRLSAMLGCLSEYHTDEMPMPKYRYASAGSLHPVQVYLYVKPDRIQGLPGGFYYYQPEQHQLFRLAGQHELTKAYWGVGDNPEIFERASFSLFLVGEMNAIEPVYGAEDARGMMYLEAGYMSQLLLETAPDECVGLCPMGYLDPQVGRLLGLGASQSILHCMVGGAISPDQIHRWTSQLTLSEPTAAAADHPHQALADLLSARLPAYMVPATFVTVDKLPLTANGKVDRKKLMQEKVVAAVQQPKVMPVNELESELLAIWQQVLQTQQLGTEDNFFEVGGDSVLILKVHQKLGRELNIQVNVVDLFKYPKITNLARHISQSTKLPDAPAVSTANTAKQKSAIQRQRQLATRRPV